MEKEKNTVSLDERIARVRERAEKSEHSTFKYKFMTSPYFKEGCKYFELSTEGVERIIPHFEGVFQRDIEVSRFNVLCVSGENYMKLGIDNGEGLINDKKCGFKYLMVQNGEFTAIQAICKDEDGKGIDHEVYPVFTVSCMPEGSQELMSSILDVLEDRLV